MSIKRRERRRGTLLGAALAGGVALAAAASVEAASLEEAVRAALTSNPQVSEANALQRAASQDLREARGGYFPSVDLSASYGRERSDIKSLPGTDARYLNRREASLRVSQLLFDGFATRSEVERRAALLESAGYRAEDTREAVAFRAVQAYLEVLKQQRLVDLARDNVTRHEESLDKVRRRVRSGVNQRADLQQAEARLALAQSTLTAREGGLWESQAGYRRVIGEFPQGLLDPAPVARGFAEEGQVDTAGVARAIESATEEALAENPALRAAKAEVEAASAEIRRARAGYMPRLNLEASVRREDDVEGVEGVRNIDLVGVVGSWNLYRGGSDKAREQAAVERRVAALDVAADVQRNVEENVAIALQAKATSEARLLPLREHVRASEQTLDSYQRQLELGRRTLLDVLNAENELFLARSNLASGRYDDLVNQYFVEAAKGKLVDSLGISSAGDAGG